MNVGRLIAQVNYEWDDLDSYLENDIPPIGELQVSHVSRALGKMSIVMSSTSLLARGLKNEKSQAEALRGLIHNLNKVLPVLESMAEELET